MIDTSKTITGVNVNGTSMNVGDLATKTITENGTYNAQTTDGVNGYSEVTVNVSGGGGATFASYANARGNGNGLFQNFSTLTTSQLQSFMTGVSTSSWANCASMFNGCHALGTLPAVFDTSNVTNGNSMCNYCVNLTSFQLDMSNMIDTTSMFSYCTSLVNLTLTNAYSISYASYMFYDCANLETVSGIDWSNLTGNSSTDGMFIGCTKLHDIGSLSGLEVNLNVSYSTAWSVTEMVNLVASLDDISWTGTSRTLTIGATNLAKLSQSDIDAATAKGWTLA